MEIAILAVMRHELLVLEYLVKAVVKQVFLIEDKDEPEKTLVLGSLRVELVVHIRN
jgi:hypothetical protein